MGVIDTLDNFKLLRKRKNKRTGVSLLQITKSNRKSACMPSSEQLKEQYVAHVTHLKKK